MKDVWIYGDQTIEIVTSFKYLGFNITSGGSFKGTIQDLTNSARRAIFGLKSIIHRFIFVTLKSISQKILEEINTN